MKIFDNLETELWREFDSIGFSRVGQGLFTKKMSPISLSWISFTGNDYFYSTLIGVVFPRIVNKMYKILNVIRPQSAIHRLPATAGPPLMVLPLTTLLSPMPTKASNEKEKDFVEQITFDDIDNVVAQILANGLNFLEENKEMGLCLESAIRYCKFGEAQKYLIPLAMYDLNFDANEIESYTNLCASSYSDHENRLIYEQYVQYLMTAA